MVKKKNTFKTSLRDTNTYLVNGSRKEPTSGDIFAPDVDESKLAYPAGRIPNKVSWNGSIKCKECAFCLAVALVVLFIFALSIALGN